MTDGLTEKDRSGIRAVLKANPKVRRAVLFGSRAMGTFRGASDVDLALEGEDINLKDLIVIKAQIEKSSLPIEVDLVVRAQIDNPELEKHIRTYGREWFRKSVDESVKWNKTMLLRDLLVTTKDGDWGKENPEEGFVPYHIIRGTDFPDVRVGDVSSVPQRYLPEHTATRRTLEPDDILIETAGGTRDRPTGRTLLITKRILAQFHGHVTCASFARFLRIDRTQADPRFVFWYLQHLYNKGEMSQHQVQHTGVARFQYTCFSETQNVPLPPLPEQKAIAAVLGALDDKIELNQRMNATLETMARALFQSWFVDFDPIRAKLDGCQPRGLDETTVAHFPSCFEHEDEGVVPKGWERKRWGDIATLEYGKSLRDYREGAGKYRVFGTNGPIGYHDQALCETEGIVIGRKGAYRGIHYSPEPFFVIDTAFYLKPKERLDLKWAYYELLRFDINGMDSGSAIPSTSRDDFYGIPAVLPPLKIQQAFGKIVGRWLAKVYANQSESRMLAAVRDALLPKLLSGELRANKLESSV